MKLRFFNARILSMEEGMEITMGEVWTEGTRILYAGPSAAKLSEAAKRRHRI